MAWTGKSSAKTGCPRNSSSRPATPWPCKSWRLRVGGKSKKVTVGYKYYSGQHHVCCHGPIDYFSRILVDDRFAWTGEEDGGQITIDAADLFGGESREGGVSGPVDFEMGLPTQEIGRASCRERGCQ